MRGAERASRGRGGGQAVGACGGVQVLVYRVGAEAVDVSRLPLHHHARVVVYFPYVVAVVRLPVVQLGIYGGLRTAYASPRMRIYI